MILIFIIAICFAQVTAILLSSPAAEGVTTGNNLFDFEKLQCTDNVLADLSKRGLDVSRYGFQRLPLRPRNLERRKCKTYPGDEEWPREYLWAEFKDLLGGALIKTVPEASICYKNGSVSNSSECQSLTSSWGNSTLRIEDPTSIRAVLFQGLTCVPPSFTGYFLGNTPECSIGGFPEFVVKAINVAQIQLAVNFAREQNLRLVIKNTGHDFASRSTGKGAISIWTHHLKDFKYFANYTTGTYQGPAVKLGSGVQVGEVNQFAKEHGVTIVGGEGKTVGHVGGYIQGGGHSPLTSIVGMGADHVLSINLVTADGRFITADSQTNSDIFWAVRGGGGSTYGVVTSMVIKVYPKMRVTTMRYNMTTGSNYTHDDFWAAHKAYVDDFEKYADLGYYSYYRIRHVGTEIVHDATSWVAPNTTEEEFRASVAPMFAKWKFLGVPFKPIIEEYDNYSDAWADGFPQEAWTVTMRQTSRFIPRENIANEIKRAELLHAIRGIFDEGANLIMFNMRNPPGSAAIDNAVNQAWRDILMFVIPFVTWNGTDATEYVTEKSMNLTFEWNPRLKRLTQGSGTYMSESDYIEPDWQQSFWGNKYDKLLRIKQKWDPEGVFYAHNAVGSEDWEMSELLLGHLPSQNSKLCRRT